MKTLLFAAMRPIALATPLAIAAPAAAQMPDWAHAQRAEITMTDHGFVPRRLLLKAGVPTVIRLVNPSSRTHNFAAKDFFRNAEFGPRAGRMIESGDVNVAPGDEATLRFITPRTPGAGYSFKSTHIEDAGSDMTGNIFLRR